MLILDTQPLVNFFKGQSEIVRNIISNSEFGKPELGISVITLSELFYVLANFRGTDFAIACIESIKLQLNTIAVSAEIAEKAGELKYRYAGKERKGFPMADAIIAATAWIHDAHLLTSDPHFDKVKEIKVRKL